MGTEKTDIYKECSTISHCICKITFSSILFSFCSVPSLPSSLFPFCVLACNMMQEIDKKFFFFFNELLKCTQIHVRMMLLWHDYTLPRVTHILPILVQFVLWDHLFHLKKICFTKMLGFFYLIWCFKMQNDFSFCVFKDKNLKRFFFSNTGVIVLKMYPVFKSDETKSDWFTSLHIMSKKYTYRRPEPRARVQNINPYYFFQI